jgi:hypothetical protein
MRLHVTIAGSGLTLIHVAIAGRRWGWDQDKEINCAFKDTSTGQPIYIPLPTPVPGDKNAAGLAPNALPPSAAGEIAAVSSHISTRAAALPFSAFQLSMPQKVSFRKLCLAVLNA